jgi:arsenite methyltransferase
MDGSINTKNEIKDRYKVESNNTCNLSCGSNIDFLQIKKCEKILDLGSGRGDESIEVAKLTGIDGLVIGLDLTKEMVDFANEKAKNKNIKNVKFIEGDIEKLPFENEYFDGVMSNCVINHAKSKVKVFEEINRVLKTGGRFVISDAVTKNELPEEIKNDPRAVAECFGGAITKGEYIEAIKVAGFNSVEILKNREYVKNDYKFMSITIKALKIQNLKEKFKNDFV